MNFCALKRTDLPLITELRNKQLAGLRTPYELTEDMQEEFFDKVINNRVANARFWAATEGGRTLGMVGFTGIEWENRCAELSVTVDQQDLMAELIAGVLNLGFNYLNLENIYDITYECNERFNKWMQIADYLGAETSLLPARKYWDGKYYRAYYWNYCKKWQEYPID